jgi:Fe(3+) dicitrate transport protein
VMSDRGLRRARVLGIALLVIGCAAPARAQLVTDAGLLESGSDAGQAEVDASPADAEALADAAEVAEAGPESEDAALPSNTGAVAVPIALPTPAPVAAPPAPVAARPAATEPVEVTVVGTRLSRTAGSAHVIRAKELERFEYDDPQKILLSVPGLYVRGEDGMGLRPNIGIRGVDPDRSKKVTLIEDGVLFGPSPYSAPAAYFFPIMTRLEKVRVIKGPGAVAYGPQTVGGTIDLVTRSIPTRTSGAADVAVGQYGYGKAHVYGGSSTEQVGFLIEGVHLQNNGFKELPNGADTGFARNEWMAKAFYVIDPRARIKNELNLKLTYSDEVSNETYLGLTDIDFRRDPDRRYMASQLDRMENHRTSIVVGHRLDVSPKLSLTTNAYRHDFERTWRKVNGMGFGPDLFAVLRGAGDYTQSGQQTFEPQLNLLTGREDSLDLSRDTILIGPNQRNFVAQGVESRLRWDTNAGPVTFRFEAGARYHYDSIDRRHSQSPYVVVDGELAPNDAPPEVTAYNRAWTHAVALHTVLAASWEGLTLTPGIRAELIRSALSDYLEDVTHRRSLGVPLPGVGAFYAITEQLGVLAGVYQGFSPPPPGSDKRNKPEKSINYEAGARYTRGALRLESIGFYNDYKNLTTLCTFSTTCPAQDVDKQYDLGAVRIYGVEVGGEHAIPAGPVKLPVQLAYTFTRSEFVKDLMSEAPSIGNARAGDQMPYLPPHQLRAALGVEHRRAGGNVAFTYVARAREEARAPRGQSTLFTDEQFITDLAAYVTLWKTISLYGTVQNLFDSRYIVGRRPFGARPNAPRWIQVGLKGSF